MTGGTYQCLFFMNGRVEYWENVTADGDVSIQALLTEMLGEGNWHYAEAWRDNVLVSRLMKPDSLPHLVASVSKSAQ
jgi:hypothetical protein